MVQDELQTSSCANRFTLVPTMIYLRPFIHRCVQDVGQEGRFRMKEMQEKCYSSGRTTTESLESVLRVERLVSDVNA